MQLTDFDALSFDCYGTLIDWEQGIWDATAGWRQRTDFDPGRDRLLEAFGSLESAAETAHPEMRYPQILAVVMRGLAERFGAPADEDELRRFAASVGDWPAFSDSAAALQRLSSRYALIILSNVDRRSFAASNERLGIAFDAIITAEDVGSYKPDARNFQELLAAAERRGTPPSRLLHVAQSLFHDHVPAKAAGLATVWIDRRRGRTGSGATPPPEVPVEPDFTFPTMEAFAGATEEAAVRRQDATTERGDAT